ncbi:P-loop containing region of AAA domain-containing protein [Bifidobacterium goeldii]|uniref:P-loop containing region of AAA domain-containing protein n=1 Tax=Bifidobacterium goeldii TaxID=2306975 RepID=A0A430FLT8_9BIFI|nr:ATP-binding protein [Bifidobacterium goeldii]RSX53711.1 P-loop containing region of AAA domain-containing protein [Bifidobacterium goeldii]
MPAALQMIADRWMMESRRLVNWGSYEGYHEFRPSMDKNLPVTLLAGASESGKSTLVDAQISLLYPTGTPFNKASNSGRSERNDYTYLLGMTGTGDDDRPNYLRGHDSDGAPQAVWGAIVDTYRNLTDGQTLSCGKFLYLLPGDEKNAVRRQYAVWDKPIDPRAMDQYRDAPFTPTQLKTAYPQCLTFPSAEAFHAHIWPIMGLSADACRLLAKIQSADAPSRLDDIFKQGVLGVPEALGLARSTVEDYDRYAENFRSMEDKAKRMDKLRDIRDSYEAYDAARREANRFRTVDPSTPDGVHTIRRWSIARMAATVAAQLPADEAERDTRQSDADAAGRHADELNARIDAIRSQINGLDGGNLARLEYELATARHTLETVASTRERITRAYNAIGTAMPADGKAWEQARIDAATFKREYAQRNDELEAARDTAASARADANATLRALERDYRRQSAQRTRITQQMDDARAMLCRATGLKPEELPYVAELMDVHDADEAWRLAMNVVYAPIAQTILVDKRHEQGFAAKVSTIDPHAMIRRTWQFVDTTRRSDNGNTIAAALADAADGYADVDHGKADPVYADASDWMSSKLRFREDSPFTAWLREQTRSERFDARCVKAIDDTDRATRQVQVDGQIKSGKRGQHGVKDRQQIIGFVNEQYLEQLRQHIDDARTAADKAEHAYADAKAASERLRNENMLADQLAYTTWENVDMEGAEQRIRDIETTIKSIKDNPKLAELTDLKDALGDELGHALRRQSEARQAADQAAAAVDAARAWLADHHEATNAATADGQQSASLDDDVAATLRTAYDQRFDSLPNDTMRAHMIIGAGNRVGNSAVAAGKPFDERIIDGIGKDMSAIIARLNNTVEAKRTAVELRMAGYAEQYASDDDALTASVNDYRYYLEELEGLSQLVATTATAGEYHRCLNHLLMSLLTLKRTLDTDAGDIRDQLDRINAMLQGQQFGPRHGSLSLHADVRRPDRDFSAKLQHAIGTLNDWKTSQGQVDAIDPKRTFAACAAIIELLRVDLAKVKDVNGVRDYGARNLDPRCRSAFYALVHHSDGQDERITSTGGRSGGALQELTSFVYGAALIYMLGGGMERRLKPSYTTLFLDEALIKADGRYTRRALTVLPRLGFQVIVSAPESKTGEIIEVSTKAYVTVKDPNSGRTSLREATWSGYETDEELA